MTTHEGLAADAPISFLLLPAFDLFCEGCNRGMQQ
jgi:hypothetical protein